MPIACVSHLTLTEKETALFSSISSCFVLLRPRCGWIERTRVRACKMWRGLVSRTLDRLDSQLVLLLPQTISNFLYFAFRRNQSCDAVFALFFSFLRDNFFPVLWICYVKYEIKRTKTWWNWSTIFHKYRGSRIARLLRRSSWTSLTIEWVSIPIPSCTFISGCPALTEVEVRCNPIL